MYSPIDLMPAFFMQLGFQNLKILEPHGRILGSESIAQALKVKCVLTLTGFPKESEQFSVNQKQVLNFPNFCTCMCPYLPNGLQTTSERRLGVQTLETYLFAKFVSPQVTYKVSTSSSAKALQRSL